MPRVSGHSLSRAHLLLQNQSDYPWVSVVLMTLNNLVDRTVLHWRRIFQMSALSTVDGRLYAYHGYNG